MAARENMRHLFRVLSCDLDTLQRIDDYYNGCQDDPYMPRTADAEYRLLASRATSNWMPLLVATPAQALYVDGFRPTKGQGKANDSPEWTHWQESRLDSRQTAIHRGALKHGHSFTVTEKHEDGRVMTRGLSALNTAALYEDPANDIVPVAAMTITHWPCLVNDQVELGEGIYWDEDDRYDFVFEALGDPDSIEFSEPVPHGADSCPVTRFAAAVDLEGRTVGVVEPMIDLQNRINQTVFDLLVAQTYGSFKVRWATGMAPPIKRDAEGKAIIDADTGEPVREDINISAKRMMFAEHADVKFGTLDETPLNGYIESIDMSIRHFAAVSQTPPHHLLGQMINISGDALQAAEVALNRKTQEFRVNFGESWERVFRLAGLLAGNTASASDDAGEVIWRDMEGRSMSQIADAAAKLRELGIPDKALWRFVPGVTQTELDEWEDLAEEQDSQARLANTLNRVVEPSLRPRATTGGVNGVPAGGSV